MPLPGTNFLSFLFSWSCLARKAQPKLGRALSASWAQWAPERPSCKEPTYVKTFPMLENFFHGPCQAHLMLTWIKFSLDTNVQEFQILKMTYYILSTYQYIVQFKPVISHTQFIRNFRYSRCLFFPTLFWVVVDDLEIKMLWHDTTESHHMAIY